MEPVAIVVTVLIVISIALYVWAIYDIIKHRSGFEKKIHQGLWLMVIVFLPVIGSVTYLTIRKSIRNYTD